MNCPRCTSKLDHPDATYCMFCGAKVRLTYIEFQDDLAGYYRGPNIGDIPSLKETAAPREKANELDTAEPVFVAWPEPSNPNNPLSVVNETLLHFAAWFCPADCREEALGDIAEMLSVEQIEIGRLKAYRNLSINIFCSGCATLWAFIVAKLDGRAEKVI